MADTEVIDLLIEGGKAAPGPTTAPRLSAYKLNIGDVFKQINDRTKEYAGMQVPVKLIIDKKTREFRVEVGLPPVSSLIKKELGIEAAKITEEEKTAGKTSVGDLKIDQIVKIAKMKMSDLLARDLKSSVKQVVGTCASMPVLIEGKKPKEFLKEIDEGKWDKSI